MLRKLLVSSLLLSACYGSHEVPFGTVVEEPGAPAAVAQPLSYFRDVKPVLDAKCTQCHIEGGMGHFPLTTYDEVSTLANVIKAAVGSGRMPPWRAAGPLDKYVGDRRLTDAQKAVIMSWVDQGAPPGDPAEAPPAAAQPPRGLARVDARLPIPGPYTPLEEPDNYRCFVLDWPYAQNKYITGLGVVPTQADIVHHAVLYLIQPENLAAIRERDAAGEGPGYDCFGVETGLSTWLTSYEPGGYGQDNPGGLGFEVRPGSALVLQMHYNTLRAKGADHSEVQLMLEDSAPRVGKVSLVLNQLWAVGFMPIGANQPDVVHTWTGRPRDLAADRAYDLYWADLHMHTLGSAASMGIVRAGTSVREPLLDIPDWAFEWQETYRLAQPVRLNPGDQLYVECHFDNTEPNQLVVNGQRQPVRDVNWGENTIDEMCLGNVLGDPSAELISVAPVSRGTPWHASEPPCARNARRDPAAARITLAVARHGPAASTRAGSCIAAWSACERRRRARSKM